MDDARTLAAVRRRRRWARDRVRRTSLRIHTLRLADAFERHQHETVLTAKIIRAYARTTAEVDEDLALREIIDRMWENA